MYVCVRHACLQLSEARDSIGSLELKLEVLLKLRDLLVILKSFELSRGCKSSSSEPLLQPSGSLLYFS